MVLSSTSASIEQNNLTTVHAMTKLFVLFCSAQDGESVDMTSLVFWAHCKKHKISTNIKSIIWNKGIITNFGYFSWYKKLISLKCVHVVDTEWNKEITLIVLYSVVEIFICRNHKNLAFDGLDVIPHKQTTVCYNSIFDKQKICLWCGAWSILKCIFW